MKKFYFAWAFAVVATFALLGLAAANPFAGTPVTDDEAAQLLGGQTGCGCLSLVPCNGVGGCSASCYFGSIGCSLPNTVGYSGTKCGDQSGCNQCYYSYGPCVATLTIANPTSDSP